MCENMEKVAGVLSDLEEKHNIHIIYAVESGSRAWGMAGTDSDYDIRFVYIHKDVKRYLSLSPPDKTIDGFSEDRLYDWQGWELSKALGHLRDTNPSLVEWVYSPIVYKCETDPIDFGHAARELLEKSRRVGALLQHYYSMAKKHYITFIEGKDQVNVKKYMYAIRPVAMMDWILNNKETTGKIIQINVNDLFTDIKPIVGDEIYEALLILNEKKQKMTEGELTARVPVIDKWVEFAFSPEGYERVKALHHKQPEKCEVADLDEMLFKYLQI